MVAVNPECPNFESSRMKTGQPASAIRVAGVSQTVTNHHIGHLMDGVHVMQAQPDHRASDVEGRLHYMVHRHPNADYLCLIASYVGISGKGVVEGEVRAQAGNGTVASATLRTSVGTALDTRLVLAIPWHANDRCVKEVWVSTLDIGLQSLTICDWPRETMDRNDYAVHCVDYPSHRCGIRESDAISDSAEAGGVALIDGPGECWDTFHPQAGAWAADDLHKLTVTSDSYTNPFGDGNDLVWRYRAPMCGSDDRLPVTVWAHTWMSGTSTEYAIQCVTTNPSANNHTASLGGLDNTDGEWFHVDTFVDVASEATMEFKMKSDQADGSVHIDGLSIVRTYPATQAFGEVCADTCECITGTCTGGICLGIIG